MMLNSLKIIYKETLLIWVEKLSFVWTVCGKFVDFSCSDIFLFCKHSPLRHFPFNPLVDCSCYVFIILLKCILNHVKCVCFEFGKLYPDFLCIEQVSIFASCYLKIARAVTTKLYNIREKKSLMNRVCWEKLTRMDIVNLKKKIFQGWDV